METTFRITKQEIVALYAMTACSLLIAACPVKMKYFMPASKIEEGTLVERSDSLKTVIIPDIIPVE